MIDSPKKLAQAAYLFANNPWKTEKLIDKDEFPLAVVSFELKQLTGKDYDFLLKYTTEENAKYIFRQIQSFPATWLLTNKEALNYDTIAGSRKNDFIRLIANYLQWTELPINPMKPFKKLAEVSIPGLLEENEYSKKKHGHIYIPIGEFSDNTRMKLDVSLLEQTVTYDLASGELHPKLYKNILDR